MKGKPVFDYKKCMACGICVQECPVSCLTLAKTDVDRYLKAYPKLGEGCISCLKCEKACPYDAVIVK